MSFRNIDIKGAYNDINRAKQDARDLDVIITELKENLRELKEEDFIVFIIGVLCSLEHREDKLFDNLDSPMKQMLYLIDIFYSIKDRNPIHPMDNSRWKKITELLKEIEMNYFTCIGYSNNGDYFYDNRDDKAFVSLMTYLNYFTNAQLSYDEQTLWRLKHYCSPYNNEIHAEFGFNVDDAITYLKYLSSLYNDKLNIIFQKPDKYLYYINHPNEWQKLTEYWINAGIPPSQWWNQPELKDIADLMRTNPGECFVNDIESLYCEFIDKDVNDRLIAFLRFNPDEIPQKALYYGAERYYSSHPLLIIGRKIVVPYIKFLIEAFYSRIDNYLSKNTKFGIKYKQAKDSKLEDKVLDVFKKLFGNDAHYYKSYSVDGRSEQDLLIQYKGVFFIVEVKDCNFREPMRDPLKAFDKIKKDFQSAIQKGYEQCKRVEDVLCSGKPITISDGKSFEKLYIVKPNRVQQVHRLVVTQYKYGPIQTDLSHLLVIDDGDYYPWSVCIDDLEAFILLLKKKFRKGAIHHFINYVLIREGFHEHLICSDELELCGYFICQPQEFKQASNMDYVIVTFPGMTDVFEAYYKVGLGFDNELNIDIKRNYPIPKYAKSFDLNLIGINDINK